MDVFGDFEPMFESRRWHNFFFFFNVFIFFVFFLSLLLQCKFANSTLLSLLSFSYFITPYDAQACSAFSALITLVSNLAVIVTDLKNCLFSDWMFWLKFFKDP